MAMQSRNFDANWIPGRSTILDSNLRIVLTTHTLSAMMFLRFIISMHIVPLKGCFGCVQRFPWKLFWTTTGKLLLKLLFE